jgi:transposase-like protein
MRRKRCPRCGSLNTQRRGSYSAKIVASWGKRQREIQRYCCLHCHSWFSEKTETKTTNRYEPSLILKAADLYFNAEASYRAVGRQLHIRPYQVFLWINELGSNCKSFEDVARELSPKYSGYFLADATTVFIQGEKNQLLLVADVKSQDIPYAVLSKSEDYPSWKRVLQGLKEKIGYPAKGVVLDKDPGLVRAIQEVFPGIPIQLCVRHLHSYHVYHLRYLFQGPKEATTPFLDITHKMLYAKSLGHLEYLFKEYSLIRPFFIQKGLRAEVLNFESKMNLIWTHFQYPQLPRTNNIIEGIIDKLKHKITDCHGFTSHKTAWNSIKMITMNYRFHKFTCSRIGGHNGQSPLQIAGANTSKTNWIRFSQKNAH